MSAEIHIELDRPVDSIGSRWHIHVVTSGDGGDESCSLVMRAAVCGPLVVVARAVAHRTKAGHGTQLHANGVDLLLARFKRMQVRSMLEAADALADRYPVGQLVRQRARC